MDEKAGSPGAVVRSARKNKGLTQADLARRVGTNQQTIGKIELGTIVYSRFFTRIAAELGVALDSLQPDVLNPHQPAKIVPGADLRTSENDLPVHAAAEGGGGEILVSTEAVDWVMRPAPLANVARAYGIIVVGESMMPEFEPGDVALINPHLPPIRDATFIFYAEQDGETKATIKRLVSFTTISWLVRQWNPARGQKLEFSLARSEWGKCHRVVGKYSRS